MGLSVLVGGGGAMLAPMVLRGDMSPIQPVQRLGVVPSRAVEGVREPLHPPWVHCPELGRVV